MANRSYLYTCDETPSGKGFYARGLNEYGWNIPLVHKLMMAGSPRVVHSAIWDRDIGILADRAGAFERVIAFLDKVAEGKISKRAELDSELAEMKQFLGKAPPSRYLLLEAGEIFDIMDGDLDKHAKDLIAEIPKLVAKADRAIAGKEAKWLDQLRKKWRDEVSTGFWSDVLYFSFTPPKKAKAKAKPTAKAKAKPTTKTKPAATKRTPAKRK